jgi:RimJ/RimL family protein N-acetyltransferase
MATLTTERLELRRFRRSDAESLNNVFGDSEVMRFGDGVQNAKWIDEWLSLRLNEYRRESPTGCWAIVEQTTQHTVGYCGLFFFPDVCGRPETEIGYRLARSYWGFGYATEAAQTVRDYAFNSLHLSRLIAMIDPQNVSSIRVAKKLGMRLEKEVMLPGYSHPDDIYAIERPDSTIVSAPR